jgi:curved DNA-binding protein CbpA
MTDYFALLEQPRRPWLDLEKLGQKYRELARTTHPDNSPDCEEAPFDQVNTAYRTLRDPKLRLQHLLRLEGKAAPTATSDIPPELAELFMNIAPVLKRRSKPEIEVWLRRVEELLDESLQQLRALSEKWNKFSLPQAETLYRCFSFLARWQELLADERL